MRGRWGFSPWAALSGARVLVVGAGDPRHLVRTLAEGEEAASREFYLLEQSLHVYCRQVAVQWFSRPNTSDEDSITISYSVN